MSSWIRPRPDKQDNLFNSLYYFVVPKSLFDKPLALYMFIKNEEEASADSMPNRVAAYFAQTEGGGNGYRLNDLLESIRVAINHPAQAVQMKIVGE